MARLPSIGVSFMSLYERETTLEQVIAHLGLSPMSTERKEAIRFELGQVIGQWSDAQDPTGALQLKDLIAKLHLTAPHGEEQVRENVDKLNSLLHDRIRQRPLEREAVVAGLKSVAQRLEDAETSLRGRETGLHARRDIEVSNAIVRILDLNPELPVVADEFLRNLCDQLAAVAHAGRIAAADLEGLKAKAGRPVLSWYDEFAKVLLSIAAENNISSSVLTDRISGEPIGPFFELASEFERLLLPPMRADQAGARAKRLQRALGRLGGSASQNLAKSKPKKRASKS
jgi:hypothetical protein